MQKQHRKLDIIRHAIRPGEGTLVDVTVTNFAEPGGMSGAQLTINTNNAPVPERRYAADVFSVTAEPDSVKLLFGQRRIGRGDELRALVVVQMSPRAVTQMLDTIASVKNPSFEEIAQREGIVPAGSTPVGPEPDQTIQLAANFVLCAISGPEASVDFYQASPFAILAVMRARKLALDAVVRVDLSSALFLGMVGELKKISAKFPPPRRGVVHEHE